MFDIIIPVYNAMPHVRYCILSVFRNSTLPFHLYIVNDASTAETTRALINLLKQFDSSQYTYIESPENLGYTKTINIGIRAGNNPYVICLNSDAVVTEQHLEKVLYSFKQDEAIGIVNPVNNFTGWARICKHFPPGHSLISLSTRISTLSQVNPVANIYRAIGFYFAVKRSVLINLNNFDETYQHGYHEEIDFCMRALSNGFRVVIHENLFIHHHGKASFGKIKSKFFSRKNKPLFMSRWADDYKYYKTKWKKEKPISYLDFLYRLNLLYRKKKTKFPRKLKINYSISTILKTKRPKEILNIDLNTLSTAIHSDALHADINKIIFLLTDRVDENKLSAVIQLANELIAQGIDANIFTLHPIPKKLYQSQPSFFRAHTFKSIKALNKPFFLEHVVIKPTYPLEIS
jgi:GT2 family glycosyltransferase